MDAKQGKVTSKCWRSVKQYLTDFCKSTSFHGLKYITEERRHWVERWVYPPLATIPLHLCC
jgi:hypothetical protein